MTRSETDQRTPERRALDEQIAAEPQLAPLDLPPDATSLSVEAYLGQQPARPGRRAWPMAPSPDPPADPPADPPEPSALGSAVVDAL